MKQTMIGILCLFSFSLGCRHLSKEECITGAWEEIGRQDGASGETSDKFADHVEECREYKVTPDKTLYMSGRSQGLRRYCTPENGWEMGKRGRTYNSVCPPQLEDAFMQGYNAGKQIYDIDNQIYDIERNITRAQKRLDNPLVSPGEARDLRREIRRLEDERRELRRIRSEIQGFSQAWPTLEQSKYLAVFTTLSQNTGLQCRTLQ